MGKKTALVKTRTWKAEKDGHMKGTEVWFPPALSYRSLH